MLSYAKKLMMTCHLKPGIKRSHRWCLNRTVVTSVEAKAAPTFENSQCFWSGVVKTAHPFCEGSQDILFIKTVMVRAMVNERVYLRVWRLLVFIIFVCDQRRSRGFLLGGIL